MTDHSRIHAKHRSIRLAHVETSQAKWTNGPAVTARKRIPAKSSIAARTKCPCAVCAGNWERVSVASIRCLYERRKDGSFLKEAARAKAVKLGHTVRAIATTAAGLDDVIQSSEGTECDKRRVG